MVYTDLLPMSGLTRISYGLAVWPACGGLANGYARFRTTTVKPFLDTPHRYAQSSVNSER